jgi:hypothetical protein
MIFVSFCVVQHHATIIPTQMHCYTLKTYAPAGFEPGSSVPLADTMTTAPRHQGINANKTFPGIDDRAFERLCATPGVPGIDFIKLHFGRKFY